MSPLSRDEAVTNIQEWTVSGLSGALKRTLEDAFGYVRLRGEVSGYRGPHSSGHCYFALKDEGAKIEAVIWKGVFQRLKVKPQEGLEVVVTGKITTFPSSSKYQIVIDTIEPAGLGALMAILEERRRKLAAEGLFDEARKQLLPYLPAVIGVVTSPTGAVIRDILHRLEDRFPRHVLVWPVRVQGETSAAEVAAAIRGFNALPAGGAIPRPDVVIVARGGGSLEDLWSFNEEIVVRAAAESDIPLVSAVGHETDWTLIDLAADLRAPTPTGAAEKVVPVRSELVAQVGDLARRQVGAVLRYLDRHRTELRSAARALPGPEDLLSRPRQRLDLAGGKLVHALRANARRHEVALNEAVQRLARLSPAARLAATRARLDGFGQRLVAGLAANTQRRTNAFVRIATRLTAQPIVLRLDRGSERLIAAGERLGRAHRARLRTEATRLGAMWKLVEGLSHKGVLARGYTLVLDTARRPVRSAAAVMPGMGLAIVFADGEVAATADGGPVPQRAKPAPAAKAAPRPKTGGASQGSLF
ncbi:exodeoxyribonuclease VII large subunit [Chelatococcus sp. SYSU_G07232]|uniref:Exodeoxyribonuclease 7 large subunit n=1 Tax=Chelatococcus albus TaxID=3047466 RepID=A0ABT7AER7_9HYPH|nr:exodeoxyribonuclease VII large subunit [Chelatococcus sp. SYSU_G07232]MDJ1157866.1 exodeoxyribonuclease VII large subunit [Chelatococcus sp. SYSU_G07232]